MDTARRCRFSLPLRRGGSGGGAGTGLVTGHPSRPKPKARKRAWFPHAARGGTGGCNGGLCPPCQVEHGERRSRSPVRGAVLPRTTCCLRYQPYDLYDRLATGNRQRESKLCNPHMHRFSKFMLRIVAIAKYNWAAGKKQSALKTLTRATLRTIPWCPLPWAQCRQSGR